MSTGKLDQWTHRFELLPGQIMAAPLTVVTFPESTGPGSISVTVYWNLDDKKNRYAIQKALGLEQYNFPLKLVSGDFNNPSSYNTPNVLFKSYCEVIAQNPDNSLFYRNLCKKILMQNFLAREDFLATIQFKDSTRFSFLGDADPEPNHFPKHPVFSDKTWADIPDFLKKNTLHRITEYSIEPPYEWLTVTIPSVYNTDSRISNNLRLGKKIALYAGNYIAKFENESGDSVDVPFEITEQRPELTISPNNNIQEHK
jgi:hypothetical protein